MQCGKEDSRESCHCCPPVSWPSWLEHEDPWLPAWEAWTPTPLSLRQGSELLRDPSLGVEFRLHLVRMVILTEPEVGTELSGSAHSKGSQRPCSHPAPASCGFLRGR